MPDETPPTSADQAAKEQAAKEQARYAKHMGMMQERIRPHLSENFEGYVLMGYTMTEDGIRRAVIYDDCKNPLIADALRGPLIMAAKWGNGQM